MSPEKGTRMDDHHIKTVLKKTFGYDSFRNNQEEIIQTIISKKDVFAVMPTGAGKSLCYQLPAVVLDGVCIVVSPLIALMKDQVDSARHAGINADFINSSQTYEENEFVISSLINSKTDLLYVAPERFSVPRFISILQKINISFIAVDEAHCISEWGHDFRPDYLALSGIIQQFPQIPVAAFTATATKQVQEDIILKLGLRAPFTVRASFNRPNLFYQIIDKHDTNRQIAGFIEEHADEAGIIYRTSRKDVETTADFLAARGIRTLPYHAGLSTEERKANQDAFNRDKVQVIVATIAFGMGIDKSNIRFVVHADLPKNMEGYYQETGRAGRDGEQAHCLLLFSRGDIPRIRYFIGQIEDPVEQNNAFTKLNDIVNYATCTKCRRKGILSYFNELYNTENCGMCDICTDDIISVDATRDAQIILSAMARTDQRFGAGHIVDIVTGANTKKIRANRHDRIKTFGIGKGKKKDYWRTIINELLQQQIIAQSNDTYPVLTFTEKSTAILKGESTFTILQQSSRPHDREPRIQQDYNRELFAGLRQLRKEKADIEGVPPFVIFSDKTLHEMCRYFPLTEEEMLRIHGIGETKLSLYGESFKNVIAAFVEEHGITPDIPLAAPSRVKPKANSATRKETWLLLQQGLTYTEIADRRNLSTGTILGHMEQLTREGKVIPDNDHLESERVETIKKLFAQCKTTRLQPVVEKSNKSVTYEEARLVRIYLHNNGE